MVQGFLGNRSPEVHEVHRRFSVFRKKKFLSINVAYKMHTLLSFLKKLLLCTETSAMFFKIVLKIYL